MAAGRAEVAHITPAFNALPATSAAAASAAATSVIKLRAASGGTWQRGATTAAALAAAEATGAPISLLAAAGAARAAGGRAGGTTSGAMRAREAKKRRIEEDEEDEAMAKEGPHVPKRRRFALGRGRSDRPGGANAPQGRCTFAGCAYSRGWNGRHQQKKCPGAQRASPALAPHAPLWEKVPQ